MVATVGFGTSTVRHGRPAQGRRRLLAGGALGAAGLLAACGAPAAPAPSATADLRGTTVEYWGMWAPTHSEEVARLKVLESFSAQNAQGVTVNAASASGQTVANMDKINGAVAAGTPPDMTNAQSSNMALLFATGATVDVDAELKGSADWKRIRPTIYPAILENHSWKGKVFGVPSHNSSQLMYFNAVALRRAGLAPPPAGWTWDAFFEYARKAAQPPEVTAYDDEWTYTGAGMWVLNNGGRFLSPDGTKVGLTGPEAAEAVEFLEKLLRAGLMRPHDGSASGGYKELLPQQQVVFQRAIPARVPIYRRDGVDFGTTFFPVGPRNATKRSYSHGNAYSFAVFRNTDARKVQGALHAALWCARPDSGLVFARDGGVRPSYRSTVEAPEFQTALKSEAQTWPFFEVLPNFLPLPNFPTFERARAAVDTNIQAVWAGKASLRDGLNEAQRAAQLILDESLRLG
jgi:multiple sugar transport system substrate-binding protein